MGFFQMLANDRGFMFFYALMKMTCGITDIIRIARITFENVNNALVVNQSGLLFLYLELFLDLTTRENWLYISSDTSNTNNNERSLFHVFYHILFLYNF